MGTRGTITVIFNGRKFRLYNHWDSYPSGLGEDLLAELRQLLQSMTLEQLRAALDKMVIIQMDENGKTRAPTEEEIKALEPFTDLTVSTKSTSDWYCLLRGCQGSLTSTIEAGFVLDYGDGEEEYNYVIDVDQARYYCKECESAFTYTFEELQQSKKQKNDSDEDKEEDGGEKKEAKEEDHAATAEKQATDVVWDKQDATVLRKDNDAAGASTSS